MDSERLRKIRKEKKITQKEMGEVIEKADDVYSKKERGEIEFNLAEVVMVSKKLNLSASEVNEIFFGGELPIDNSERKNCYVRTRVSRIHWCKKQGRYVRSPRKCEN